MRVLHVHSGNIFGGIESHLVALAGAEAPPGVITEFALSFEGALADQLREVGAAVTMLAAPRLRSPRSVLRARAALRALLAERRFDVVVVHSPWSQVVYGPTIRRAGRPLVLWLHGTISRHWLERWAGRTRPALVIANSHFTARTVPMLYPDVTVEVVYVAVPPPRELPTAAERRALRSASQTPEDAVVIIQVGRMEGWKGHALHLQALSLLGDAPAWVSWIVGGAQRPEEEAYVAGLRLQAESAGVAGRVRFLGLRENREVRRLLASADIFCQPNTGPEPFGVAIIEGMYAGLPVVTTAIGASSEIVRESCGRLVPPADPRALAAELGGLVADGELRRRLGASAPARAEELCEPTRQSRKLHEVLARVAS